MSRRNIYEEYFEWLCRQTGPLEKRLSDRTWLGNYSFLLKVLDICLYDPFRFEDEHPVDKSYAISARKLRKEFVGQYSRPDERWGLENAEIFSNVKGRGACSMLELLIVLAREMSKTRFKSDLMVFECFWEFVHNLDLDRYTDDYVDTFVVNRCNINNDLTMSLVYDEIVRKIDIFRKKEYRKDGVGGIFPIVESSKDARKMSLHAQMDEYIKIIHGLVRAES